MEYELTCPVCKTIYNQYMEFCGECGCNLSEVEAVTVSVIPNSKRGNMVNDLKKKVQIFGAKAQKGLSGASSVILDQASTVVQRTNNVAVQERVSESMSSLVNMMINVSNEVKSGIPPEMVNAIDLNARVNFVAFSIGVSVDLATLNKPKTDNVDLIDSSEVD